MKVGVLALQGAFASHAAMLGEAGATPVEVRRAHELAEVDALVMPGGESTTMSMLLDIAELSEPLAGRLADGMPVFGTCAGMILLAVEVLDGRSDQRSMGAIDLDVRRNGYGRQVDSFETELAVEGFDDAFHGVFIRSPVVERIGPDVEVLAEVEGRPVLCRQGNVLVASFHPELA
ncbi:MAG: pyridoxal 5'-phosphate synthase glutaminase subunit PdxT, partial [Acidimicrobiales bacterium]|nr:pyridoxal 5'-phosphate synthase glutaminase subunit PdxT [Acidimicrobiales bacterium]